MNKKDFETFKQAKADIRRQQKNICDEARGKIRQWLLDNKGIDITKPDEVNGYEYNIPDSHILADEHEFISVVATLDYRSNHLIGVPRTAIFPA